MVISIEGLMAGEPISGDPLFNGRIGDGHFRAGLRGLGGGRRGRRDCRVSRGDLPRPDRRGRASFPGVGVCREPAPAPRLLSDHLDETRFALRPSNSP